MGLLSRRAVLAAAAVGGLGVGWQTLRSAAAFAAADRDETLGTRLRRLADAAARANVLQSPPWLLPPSWTPSTALRVGDVVAANGGWYVAANYGTTAGEGDGPDGRAVDGVIADGSLRWEYLGKPSAHADDPRAPAVSIAPASPFRQFWGTQFHPHLFRMYGGVPNPSFGGFWRPAVPAGAGGVKISWMTDALRFAIVIYGVNPFRIVIDDGNAPRYLNISAVDLPLSQPYSVTLDFSAEGGRTVRRVDVENLCGNDTTLSFFGVGTDSDERIWAPSSADDVRVVMISDSYLAGSSFSPFRPGEGIGHGLAKLLGWSDPWNLSVGGTGYANPGGKATTYGQRVALGLPLGPDLWVFYGSTNDNAIAPAAVSAAALACYRSIRAGGSLAPIVVFGVTPVNAAAAATEAALAAAVAQFADPLDRTFFLPVAGDPAGPWITGPWNSADESNSALYINGTDHIHPLEQGVSYLSRKMAAAIRAQVLPRLS